MQSRFAPTALLIHFFARSAGWLDADFWSGSPSASRCLLLACGFGVVARYLAFCVILTKSGFSVIRCASRKKRRHLPAFLFLLESA
ncbi:hypothetical protein [Herbaspirillum sp. SJZ099]|uniref:hypothetical protein n=1 Tax=Herbaspirillum sp. SJZ099 TaxID=2572916 RepID=UPI0011A86FB1|nr:hypothetical protein [Herbaspirillum sp. SJZ099]